MGLTKADRNSEVLIISSCPNSGILLYLWAQLKLTMSLVNVSLKQNFDR